MNMVYLTKCKVMNFYLSVLSLDDVADKGGDGDDGGKLDLEAEKKRNLKILMKGNEQGLCVKL